MFVFPSDLQVQRLSQYESYFQSLLDETRPEHGRGAEYHDLCMATSAVKQVSLFITTIIIILFKYCYYFLCIFLYSFERPPPRCNDP